MAREKPTYDFSKGGPRTGGAVRRTRQEDLDAARTRAAGAPAPPYDPALHAAAGREIVDRAKRLVMGRMENKGRSPMIVLSPDQFAQHQATGEWEGAPSLQDYGLHTMAPEDKEYESQW